MDQQLCYCGSEKPFDQCCGPLLNGTGKAATAEALMRSRYTAFVLQNEAYLLSTWHESTRPGGVNLVQREDSGWLPLTVLDTEKGTAEDNTGFVEFSTAYREGGRIHPLHERSRFCREHDNWLFVESKRFETTDTERVGRNDPCPCGSGKKYKKCCG